MNSEARTVGASRQCVPLLDYLGRLARARAEAALAPLGLRPRHLVSLTILADCGSSTTQQQLGTMLLLDPSNMVGLLNELEGFDLVTRRRDSGDRRRHIVELTEHGRDVLDEVLAAMQAVEGEILGSLDQAQRDTLADLLQQAVGDTTRCANTIDQP